MEPFHGEATNGCHSAPSREQRNMTSQAMLMLADEREELLPYRALSKSAVISFTLAGLSLSALLTPPLLVIPVFGLMFGLLSLRAIRRYPDELSGRGIAWTGILLCLLIFLGASGLHSWIYATEVPPGHVRINFLMLQPNKDAPDLPFSREALNLNGKQVFVKGYVYPDGQRHDIKRFILVPDMGTCCFGGQPKLTDMIEVTLKDPYRVSYSRRKLRLAGILSVDTRKKLVTGLDGVYFQLEADHLN
jgi:hypothetical protein